jgi:hypothetical protein
MRFQKIKTLLNFEIHITKKRDSFVVPVLYLLGQSGETEVPPLAVLLPLSEKFLPEPLHRAKNGHI